MACQTKRKQSLPYRLISSWVLISFLFASIIPPTYAQSLNLPPPGAMVNPTPAFVPVLLKGMTVYPDNPLRFDFIVDGGNTKFTHDQIKEESNRLVKYFLAAMTVPQDDLWVNLSPYESDRIISDELGQTELGRDMLAQDYILKQLTATLLYPEKELGKNFWDRVYKKAQERFGTTEIPINTFNKVWIIPDEAAVYENGNAVYIVKSRLKVMLGEDYVAMANQKALTESRAPVRDQARQESSENVKLGADRLSASEIKDSASLSSQIVREVILPEIEREVNEGKNFAPIRQIYQSLILAKWYKETIKESLLSKVYIDQKKIKGVDVTDPTVKDQIYARYVEAFKKGVFDFIKEDYDQLNHEVIPRKYFSGGAKLGEISIKKVAEPDNFDAEKVGNGFRLITQINPLLSEPPADHHPGGTRIAIGFASAVRDGVSSITKLKGSINDRPILVGISGEMASGKDYFSDVLQSQIRSAADSERVYVFEGDRFVLPLSGRNKSAWPQNKVELDLLISALKSFHQGQGAYIPFYQKETGERISADPKDALNTLQLPDGRMVGILPDRYREKWANKLMKGDSALYVVLNTGEVLEHVQLEAGDIVLFSSTQALILPEIRGLLDLSFYLNTSAQQRMNNFQHDEELGLRRPSQNAEERNARLLQADEEEGAIIRSSAQYADHIVNMDTHIMEDDVINISTYHGHTLHFSPTTYRLYFDGKILLPTSPPARWGDLVKRNRAFRGIQGSNPRAIRYFPYKDVFLPIKEAKGGVVRFDLNVFLDGSIGGELVRSTGHVDRPRQVEVVEVLYGKVRIYQQRVDKKTGEVNARYFDLGEDSDFSVSVQHPGEYHATHVIHGPAVVLDTATDETFQPGEGLNYVKLYDDEEPAFSFVPGDQGIDFILNPRQPGTLARLQRIDPPHPKILEGLSLIELALTGNAQDVVTFKNGIYQHFNMPLDPSLSSESHQLGGIDMNEINVKRQGQGINTQFDPAIMQKMIHQGVDGFAPVIINLTPINSFFPILGLKDPMDKEDAYYAMSSLN